MAALDSSVGDVAQMIYMNVNLRPEATKFRLEENQLLVMKVDRAEEVDMVRIVKMPSTLHSVTSRHVRCWKPCGETCISNRYRNAERARREEEAQKEEFSDDAEEVAAEEDE